MTVQDGRALREKVGLAALLFAAWAGGYYAIAVTGDPASARSLRTSFDDAIPFVPLTIYLYVWVYTAMLLPLFVVRCRALFRRVAAGYAMVIAVSFAAFALFPVTSAGFRPPLETLPETRFHEWGLRLNFLLDPPTNLFPSLHLSIITLAALAAATARPIYGAASGALAVAVAVSVLTTKQHFVADAVAGVALGGAAWAACVRPYADAAAPPREPAYGWAGPTLYLAFHALALLGLYGLFRAGVRPWAS